MSKHTAHAHGAGHAAHDHGTGQAQGAGHDHGTGRALSAGHAHGHAHDTDDFDWGVMGTMLEQEAELSLPQYEAAARWIAGLPAAPQVRRVLDIGSGPGVITCLLAGVFPEAEVVAVDGTPALLERTRARAERNGLAGRVRTVRADLPRDLGTLDQADLIWAGNTLHHLGDQRGALAGFAALLRPGGTVALAEGGLTARYLPRDIGIGRPGLETRLEAIREDWFEDMRASLPDTRRETEDWRGLFAAVGLEPQGARSFLLDLPAPLGGVALDRAVADFTRRREVLTDLLTDEDVATLDRLLDPADPAGLRRRQDVFTLSVRTVHVARRARS
ncbi:class I SAM-dependent methyltransferase [Streptomyces sp. B1I3]|uniref:class I SAM-dependent methyltransferase n=1 Tax=Streptomyces sp. B1I3 TaxID=3042264 RepID=UPI002788B4E2|nr:class I SAM-dependent methyltransferase [Streptomyces sp. B1I3]MDQ0792887.1 SAM-dependent methyltransferase [Streptomyces sp. B1I3]